MYVDECMSVYVYGWLIVYMYGWLIVYVYMGDWLVCVYVYG